MKKLIFFIRSIRWFEIGVRMGGPLTAMLIVLPAHTRLHLMKMGLALLAFFFGWVHGYTLNEWGGYASDRLDPRRMDKPLITGNISTREMLGFSIVNAFFCVVLYAFLNPWLLIIVFFDIAIGVLYDHPKTALKAIPFASFAVLFIVSVNDVLLGWLIFSTEPVKGIIFGIFFGILGLAGISFHEAGDYESDRDAGIKTNAVRFGKKRILTAGFVFYTLSCFYFILLTILRIIPSDLYPVFIVTYPVYVYIFYRCIKAGATSAAIHLLIKRYRLLYGCIGLYLLIQLWL
ncbi:MAG TPA: hypothetical protein ENI34_00160 [candidate division WOR-3 bacterium]|uniref:Prenyltransferase n=1 Tax=candidate division WOR-3 bacterium TaxID=2052148 RepID=A0A9C9EKB2_UNCW3|nr:hypothetical protein [candidate division WOR-3 bacterium]